MQQSWDVLMEIGFPCNKAAVLGAAIKKDFVQMITEVVKCVMSFKLVLFAQDPSLHFYQDPKA
jgi:hypothetical protein